MQTKQIRISLDNHKILRHLKSTLKYTDYQDLLLHKTLTYDDALTVLIVTSDLAILDKYFENMDREAAKHETQDE